MTKQEYLDLIDGDKKYVVIGEWEEGGETKWDVLSKQHPAVPITFNDAEEFKTVMWNAWENAVHVDKQKDHKETVILWSEYVDKLEKEGEL